MEILNTYINPVALGICLVVGYIIKHWLKDVDNKIIPTVVVIVGIVVTLWINQWAVITPDVILSGALSGLASTGLHQLFKQWIEGGKHIVTPADPGPGVQHSPANDYDPRSESGLLDE